jgi:ferredoxin
MSLQKIRRALAIVFFVLITLLFLDFTGTVQIWFGWLAKIQFWPAIMALNIIVIVALLLLTLIFGRIYCSIICPLGVYQDILAKIGKHGRRNPYNYSKAKNILRYSILVVFIILTIVGLNAIAALIAPYSSYGRIASSLLQPLYLLGNNMLATLAEHADSYAFYRTDIWIKGLPTLIVASVTAVVIGFLAWRNGRTYCNTICPVGTILSFFARFSWLEIHFDSDKCRKCGKCSRNCKAACIDFNAEVIDYSRCVVCGDCLSQCSFNALHYAHSQKAKKKIDYHKESKKSESLGNPQEPSSSSTQENTKQQNTSRRSFLLATTLAVTATIKAQKDKKVDGGMAFITDKIAPKRNTPIIPPGSYSAENMAHHCTSCQLCIAECPNGVLRPSTNLETFMQPTMSYERGFCRPECTRCSEVCPTGAIKPIKREEKSSIQIGHAVWIKKNCVVIRDGVECGNCARHCPTGAIMMIPYQTANGDVQVPAVDIERCIGCGACENLCPARPFSAIYIEGHEVHKHN